MILGQTIGEIFDTTTLYLRPEVTTESNYSFLATNEIGLDVHAKLGDHS